VSMTLADPAAEGRRITDAADEAAVLLRITGGVGVALQCPSAASAPLARAYADIDCVGLSSQRGEIAELLAALGYEPDQAFNALHGHTRLFFWDAGNNRQLDVFIDRVEMCHTIDLTRRLPLRSRTLPLADLLLMKLQVFETNRKDLIDVVTLLSDHPLTQDESGIDVGYIAGLAADDWGLWRTTTMIAEKADRFARELEGFRNVGTVHTRISEYLEVLEEWPKSRRWRLRAKLGERKQWYELPEESQ
jgi:hypothetical protein